MATYVTKKCPHCGYAYQIHKGGDQRKYGCPFQTCLRCHKSYWDTDIKEPALYGYQNLHEIKETTRRGIVLIFYIPFALLMFVAGIFSLKVGEQGGILFFLMSAGIIWMIYSHFAQKAHAKKHRMEIIAQQQRDYDASMQRLKDINYLTALAEHDYLAKKLLNARINGGIEHYATRPE